MRGVNKLSRPSIPFNMTDIKMKEVNYFEKKTCVKSSPGNDGVSYKVYKKYPLFRNRLFLLLRKAWQKRIIAERWQLAERIYLSKEENSEELRQFSQYRF